MKRIISLFTSPGRAHALGRACLIAVSAASACTGQIGDGEQGDGPRPETEGFLPPEPTLRRLLVRQYVNTVRDLLGDGAALAATSPPDQPLNGFGAIGASQMNVGDAGVATYEQSARQAAAAAVNDGARIGDYLDCAPIGPDDSACYESFFRNFGHLAFRRPVSEEEVADYVTVALLASEAYGTFDAGLEHIIATALQSPSFVYQVEIGDPEVGSAGVRRVTDGELATRMSFFLLDTTPSLELLERAESGGLDEPEEVRALALELVARPQARLSVSAMYGEILGLDALESKVKSVTLFPEFGPDLVADMQEETQRLLADIVWERDADMTDLLSADYTFLTPRLAGVYGIELPIDGAPSADGWHKVEWPADQPRSGFFGQGSYLSMQSHIELTSPTLRGKFIRERLLCTSINPPPNDVVTELPEDGDYKTMREKLAAHQVNPTCAGCHSLTDPAGLSFENFDAIGRFRTQDNGVTIDTSGEFDGQGAFAGPSELADILASDPKIAECIVRNVYRASLGRVETTGEQPLIEALVADFDGDGRRLQSLLVELVSSDAFRFVGAEQ